MQNQRNAKYKYRRRDKYRLIEWDCDENDVDSLIINVGDEEDAGSKVVRIQRGS